MKNTYSEMKDSGVAWIGAIPTIWDTKHLFQLTIQVKNKNSALLEQNLLSLSYGKIKRKSIETTEGLLPASFDNYNVVEKDDIVLRLTDLQNDHTSLRVGKVEEKGIITSAYVSVRPVLGVSKYIYYALHSFDLKKGFYGMGSGVRQGLNFTEAKMIRIPFPELPEQTAIAAYLDEKCGKVDALVAAKERQVELLKELRERVIADAVTKGVGGVKTGLTGFTGLGAGDNLVNLENPVKNNRPMKASGIPWLPEVPEGWEVRKVRQHFKLRSTKVSEKEYPALSVAKIGVVPQLSDVAISMADGDSRKLVREGDYVVNSRSDRKGSCGIAPRDGSVTTISIVLEPHDINGRFVHYLFRSVPWVEEFYRNGRGIVADLWTTRYQEMRNMLFPYPPLSEQKEIVEYIERKTAKIDELAQKLEDEVKKLKEFRERLVADVVTGQRKVV